MAVVYIVELQLGTESSGVRPIQQCAGFVCGFDVCFTVAALSPGLQRQNYLQTEMHDTSLRCCMKIVHKSHMLYFRGDEITCQHKGQNGFVVD
jgi:hypothetical protein